MPLNAIYNPRPILWLEFLEQFGSQSTVGGQNNSFLAVIHTNILLQLQLLHGCNASTAIKLLAMPNKALFYGKGQLKLCSRVKASFA